MGLYDSGKPWPLYFNSLYCVCYFQNKDFKATAASREPPRLVILVNEDKVIDNAFLFSDGAVVDCKSTSVITIIQILLFCYYAWQLRYPTQYQLLGFLQEHLIPEDTDISFFKSAQYIKFNKKYRDN